MLAATLLALGSALVHASWNLLIKTSEDRAVAAWGQFTAAALVAGLGLLVIGGPGWAALPYLAGTAAVHLVYIESLVAAYTHGDFSLSYPLARGGGAVCAAVGSALVLDDRLSALGWVAIAVAGFGLVGLRGRGVPIADDVVLGEAPAVTTARAEDRARDRAGERAALGFALLTAVCIATYTIIDSAGSRAGDSGVAYGLASVAVSGTAVSLSNAARGSRRSRAGLLLTDWHRHLAGGVGTLVAYTMVLVAVRQAPVGYVTMLRESSVVIGALVGWLVLREGLGGRRLIASGVILAGLILLVVAGG
ncbi:MAG TPA: EamA family transporter [Iamia sp.]|nr:EamA family transporter [Iamia sp.]